MSYSWTSAIATVFVLTISASSGFGGIVLPPDGDGSRSDHNHIDSATLPLPDPWGGPMAPMNGPFEVIPTSVGPSPHSIGPESIPEPATALLLAGGALLALRRRRSDN
ncbi:MAG: PEP-CTERM sorting domain-containing protein [Phycisphaerales bacterium]|nr:PEP-CTERM sorting domain-containing protein [Phycisphaerales bacterium]